MSKSSRFSSVSGSVGFDKSKKILEETDHFDLDNFGPEQFGPKSPLHLQRV